MKYAMSIVALLALGSKLAISQATTGVPTRIDLYHKKLLDSGKVPSAEQGTIGSYINVGVADKEEDWKKLDTCVAGDICPDIILLDTPVRGDPSLPIQILGDPHDTPAPANGPTPILTFTPEDHGTALAGIIASHSGKTGLLGVNPQGQLFSLNWSHYGDSEDDRASLVDVLRNAFIQRKTNPPIVVLASGWRSTLPLSRLPCRGAQRFPNHDALDNFFSIRTGVLIIVSAGQDLKNGGTDITRNSTWAPQNLGDCENVIVVTACLPCVEPSPRVPDWANYSTEGLVHIAAYGDKVLSTKGNGFFTEVPGGTSPAAAFVAGVASAMIARWPTVYNFRPADLKFRIQLTSTPSLVGPEGVKLSAGILDPDYAIKDPAVDYVATLNESLHSVRDANWCVDQIRVSKNGDPTAEVILDVSTIYRIHCQGAEKCTVFHSDIDQQEVGVVERSGPGIIKGDILLKSKTTGRLEDDNDPVLFEADGATYKRGDFTEIILKAARHPISGQSCK